MSSSKAATVNAFPFHGKRTLNVYSENFQTTKKSIFLNRPFHLL